jgi:heavy metal translocating P-type ATPase
MIAYPRPGLLRLSGIPLLSRPLDEECAKLVAALFELLEVRSVEIDSRSASADVRFDPRCTPSGFAARVRAGIAARKTSERPAALPVLRPDERGRVEAFRYDGIVSSWRIVSDLPGRIRVRNVRLFRRKRLCVEIERDLMTALGVDRFSVSALTGSVLVYYDPRLIAKEQLLELLDETLLHAEEHPHADKGNHELLLCTAAVALGAAAQFAAPALLIPAGALFVYCSIPSFVGAYETLFKERRLGVDVLDTIVVLMCLASLQVFAGAVMAWCLSFGRRLLAKAQEDSRRRLVNVFGKQPRTAYAVRDGVEVLVPLDHVSPGDLIAVHTGEAIPVDGTVEDGVASVDQHALTGESVPVEKEPRSSVFASTLVIGGRLLVRVERAGKATTTAKISEILNDTAAFRLASQSKGEDLADKAVIPTLALAALGYSTIGLHGSTAIVNCDFGTGIRMAAPLALLTSLSVCAGRGILVKDGRALEQMSSVDTVLFDKTGTLTEDRPAVHRVHRFGTLGKGTILMFGAAAEQRLNHPIAAAIVDAYRSLGKPFPAIDQSSYAVGYGIAVTVDDRRVHVGSGRFMGLEAIALPKRAADAAERAHDEGHSIVFVAVDGVVEGAIELAPALRAGVREMIAKLRHLGVRQVAIVSGDHEKPTRKLSHALGVDRYFAEVLPEDKARYVEMLQQEGRKVCFVGDGINDAIALKRADVSVSLRGATTAAMDTAQVVFMEESLAKLCDLMDISRALDRNIKVSWQLIIVPNALCIAGAFFFGFGVMASVLANNVAAVAALANGLRPLQMLSQRGGRRVRARTGRPAAGGAAAHGLPSGKRAKRMAAVLIATGIAGVVVPGVPGWPLLLAAVTLLAPSNPIAFAIDRWMGRRFPKARRGAFMMFSSLYRDLQVRFPDRPAPRRLVAATR